jgi:hypothetical protein
MPFTVIHEWTVNEKHYRAVYDDTYATRGSYALDTEDETRAAEDEEIAKLESGAWIAIGIIVWEKKPHCKECQCLSKDWPWTETNSLWGIVVENDTQAIEEFARTSM